MPKIFLLEDFLHYSSFKMNQCRQQQNLHLMKNKKMMLQKMNLQFQFLFFKNQSFRPSTQAFIRTSSLLILFAGFFR